MNHKELKEKLNISESDLGEARNKKRAPKNFLIVWWNVYFGRLFEIGRQREIKFIGIKLSEKLVFGFVYDAPEHETTWCNDAIVNKGSHT